MPEEIKRTYTVAQKGIGKPDYSRTVSSGIERAGFLLKYNEAPKFIACTFSDIDSDLPWFVSPLAPGDAQDLIDFETGLELFNIPAGYYAQIIALIAKPSQDVSGWAYLDGDCVGAFLQLSGGDSHYENEVAALSTLMVDPTCASAHTLAIRIINEGGGDLYGGFSVFSLLKPYGTEPLPTSKDVKCKHCGHVHTQPLEAVLVTCPECGKETKYFSLKTYGRLP